MNARISRLPARDALPPADRRRAWRAPAEVTVQVRSVYGEEESARLADVSIHGCSISGNLAWLRTGSFISIGFGEGPELRALVRWTRGDSAGMEFLRPIPPERTEWRALIDAPFGA